MEVGNQSTLNDLMQMQSQLAGFKNILDELHSTITATATQLVSNALPSKSTTWNEAYTASSWVKIGDGNNFLGTGGYVIRVRLSTYLAGGAMYDETFTGVMSWFDGGTNNYSSQEIALHNLGHADNGAYIKLRTKRNPSGLAELQMLSNESWDGSQTFEIFVTRLA